MANDNTEVINMDVEGFDIVTDAIMDLLNDYPKLASGDSISFCGLSGSSGKGMFPQSGAIIDSDIKDIIGHTTQNCLYYFYVIYRAGGLNETRRKAVKVWLDDLGRWLEKQPITVNEETHVITEYPALTGNRKITSIKRTTPATLNEINADNVEDWTISITCKYTNEF